MEEIVDPYLVVKFREALGRVAILPCHHDHLRVTRAKINPIPQDITMLHLKAPDGSPIDKMPLPLDTVIRADTAAVPPVVN